MGIFRSGMVAVLGPFEALPYYIHTYGYLWCVLCTGLKAAIFKNSWMLSSFLNTSGTHVYTGYLYTAVTPVYTWQGRMCDSVCGFKPTSSAIVSDNDVMHAVSVL
jgi:hypothetical protein